MFRLRSSERAGRRRWVAAAALAGACSAHTGTASAQLVRRRFDPEDLKIEQPGVLHADLQLGLVRGESAGRWLVPDFDVDVGLAPNVELSLDGAVTLEGTPARPFARDHLAPDTLWLSSKIAFWQSGDETTAWTLGTQLGPRASPSANARGAGFETLFLLGRTAPRVHLVLNAGGLVDPGEEVSRRRPLAILSGFDGSIALDSDDRWSLSVDLSCVVFLTSQRDQLVTTAGPVLAVAPWLDIGLSGVLGFLAGGDRYGAFVTFAPKLPVFADAPRERGGR